jgi:hypothetical protein
VCREQIAYAPRLGEALESGGTERRDNRVDTVQVAVLVGELMREGGTKGVRHEHKLETSANGDDKGMMRDERDGVYVGGARSYARDVDELLEGQRAFREVWSREDLRRHPVLQSRLVLLPHVVVLLYIYIQISRTKS